MKYVIMLKKNSKCVVSKKKPFVEYKTIIDIIFNSQ